ncbi:fluoride efflux transporter CrcB [Paenibacillus senegalensis]|uniref:fluoride efflux transporter CrcB n=1 Tax=Paenibacillus senegalensis TaxID=1465766 RepID=UPI000287B04D|nr:fluoride efflux transporter CrcB [Paenibacillus senegalensis]
MRKGDWSLIAAVGAAGALGALARYFAGLGASWIWGEPLPWGTLVVNLSGCMLLGFMTNWLSNHIHWPAWIAPVLGTGFIGSYTTFSTLSAEMLLWLQQGRWGIAILYVLVSALGGLAAIIIGWNAAERLSSQRRESK